MGKRFKFQTCKKLNRPHRAMLRRLDVEKVSVKDFTAYFTTQSPETVQKYFQRIGIELIEIT